MVTIAAPSLSAVAALPALHLPVQRKPKPKPAKKKKPATPAPRVSITPPRAARHGRSAALRRAATATQVAGAEHHLRHLRMIRRYTHGHDRPSLRWMAVGLVVALAAGLGGWVVANQIAAEPTSDAGRRSACWTPARRA